MDDKDKQTMTKRLSEVEAVERGNEICAVCGKPILGLSPDDWPHEFSVAQVLTDDGKPKRLFCHGGRCLGYVSGARTWKELPSGPLKDVYTKAIEFAKRSSQND